MQGVGEGEGPSIIVYQTKFLGLKFHLESVELHHRYATTKLYSIERLMCKESLSQKFHHEAAEAGLCPVLAWI